MKVKRFYDDLYNADVIFMTDASPVEVEEYLKRHKYPKVIGLDTTDGSVSLIDTEEDGKTCREYLVIVEKKSDFYTLLHETVHLTTHILSDRLIPIDEKNTEVFAYYQTYWFKQLWRFMNNKQAVLKRKKK